MKALVLAAGFGTRLRPLTQWIPKPLIPLFGIPILRHNLLQLREQGVRDVIINLHHMPLQIIQHLRQEEIQGMEIDYSLEPALMGTAGGIKKVENRLREGSFLVVNADTYRCMDLKRLLRHHRGRERIITLLLQENPDLAPERAVWAGRNGDVIRFLDLYGTAGSPGIPCDFLGVQVMEPEVFSYIPPRQPWEVHRVYVQLLHSGHRLGAHRQQGYWRDLGTIADYGQIHWDGLEGRSPFRIPGEEKEPGVWLAEGVTLKTGVRISPPIFVGSGSRLGKNVRIGPHAVIGSRCVIEAGATVTRSILWDDVRVQSETVLEDLLVGREFQHPILPAQGGSRP
jgi:NDP-sugar pyrophosphorylase family protein